jgi:hypothetical protein
LDASDFIGRFVKKSEDFEIDRQIGAYFYLRREKSSGTLVGIVIHSFDPHWRSANAPLPRFR